jgi:NADH-quinone oxidoreductase subunit G
LKGLGSGNVDFRPRQSDFGSDFKRAGTPWLGLRLAEIADLDAALVVGSFLRKDHPLIAQRSAPGSQEIHQGQPAVGDRR